MTATTFIVMLGSLTIFYIAIGWAVGLLAYGRGARKGMGVHFAMGFAASPLAVGVIARLLPVSLATAVVIVAGLALAAMACAAIRPRRAVSSCAPGGKNEPTDSPAARADLPRAPVWVLVLAITAACVVNVGQLKSAVERFSGPDHIVVGSNNYDFEKHAGVLTALMADGMDARHPLAPSVPLTYYTGLYVVPAGLAALHPPGAMQALFAQFFLAVIFFVILLYGCVDRIIPKDIAAARKIAMAVMLLGLSLGYQDDELASRTGSNLISMMAILNWLPQHLTALAAGLWCAVQWSELPHGSPRAWISWSIFSAFALSASAMIGAFYSCTLLICAFGWAMRGLVLPAEPTKARAYRRALMWSLAGAAVVILLTLPHYVSVIRSWRAGGGHTYVLELAERADLVLHGCWALAGWGLGALAFLIAPLLPRGRFVRGPVFVFAAGVVVAAVVFSDYSELRAKAIVAGQVLLTFLAVGCIWNICDRRWRGTRLGYVLLVLLAVNLDLSVRANLWWFRDARYNLPLASKAERDLIHWIGRHVPRDAVVSTLDGNGTAFNYLLCRRAAVAGPEMFSRLENSWGDRRLIDEYRLNHADPFSAVELSDYLYIPYEPTGPMVARTTPVDPTNCREAMLLRGYVIEKENSAGAIFRVVRRSEGVPTTVPRDLATGATSP